MTVLQADPFSTKPKNAHRTNRARYQRAHAHQAPCTPCTPPYTSTTQEPSPLKHEERAKIQWKNSSWCWPHPSMPAHPKQRNPVGARTVVRTWSSDEWRAIACPESRLWPIVLSDANAQRSPWLISQADRGSADVPFRHGWRDERRVCDPQSIGTMNEFRTANSWIGARPHMMIWSKVTRNWSNEFIFTG